MTPVQIAKIRDPREMPAYGIHEAAHYLQIPFATLNSWVRGRKYPTLSGERFFAPVIKLPDKRLSLLSFYNLAEAHVLNAFRREYEIKLQHVRSALNYVSRQFGWEHPLIEQQFETDGVRLFVERLGKIVDASAYGQIVMECARAHFQRLDWAEHRVVRLWPFTRSRFQDSPKSVFIDPRVSFGRPSLARCNVPTAVVAERYKAGDSIDALADDYGCTKLDIEEGLRCELELAA